MVKRKLGAAEQPRKGGGKRLRAINEVEEGGGGGKGMQGHELELHGIRSGLSKDSSPQGTQNPNLSTMVKRKLGAVEQPRKGGGKRLRAINEVEEGGAREGKGMQRHELELHGIRSVLQRFFASGSITWSQEEILTDLRIELHITTDEYSSELKKLGSELSRRRRRRRDKGKLVGGSSESSM